jgi:flagella basal body P-ring formation protein FlgA
MYKTFRISFMLAAMLATPSTFAQEQSAASSQFVPRNASGMATLELRPTATVYGSQITLKQVARWSRNDLTYFDALQDLVVANITSKQSTLTITHEQIRTTLHDAGVNLSTLRMTGSANVTVTISGAAPVANRASQTDVVVLEPTREIEPHVEPVPTPDINPNRAMTDAPEVDVVAAAVREQVARVQQSDLDDIVGPKLPGEEPISIPSTVMVQAQPVIDLRSMLMNELASRSKLPIEELQIDFAERDRGILSSTQPQFMFDIKPRSAVLGPVSWQVTITGGGESRRVQIDALARAWVEQAVVTKPVAMQQIISQADIETRRVLIDALPGDAFVSPSVAVGQQASRDLRPGTILTGRLVKSPELVRAGQLVTVTLSSGQVQVKAVAKAITSGARGQTIKVQNESTKQVFEVVVVGPQEAAMGDAALTSISE